MLKKLLIIRNIQSAIISSDFYENDFLGITGKNLSLKNLKIIEVEKACSLKNFQKLFPNLEKITIDSFQTPYDVHTWCGTCQMEQRGKFQRTGIIIDENKEINTDKIHIFGGGCKVMQLFCNSFENLKELIVDIENFVECINVPIFGEKINFVFKSLTNFCFCINDDDFDNTYGEKFILIMINSLDYMPNLKKFRLAFNIKDDEFRSNSKESYLKLIKKVLGLNLDEIYLSIQHKTYPYFILESILREEYTKKELIELCKEVNIKIKSFKNVYIYKLD